MDQYSITKALNQANIQYTKEPFFSNFHGTRFIFENRKIAKQAEKVLGTETKRYFKQYCIEIF